MIALLLSAALVVTVEPLKPEYAAQEPIGLRITFHNDGTEPVTVPFISFLGNTTAGPYRYSIRNLDDGSTWTVVSSRLGPAVGAPAKITQQTIAPGEDYKTHVSVPGGGFVFEKVADKSTAYFLPPGEYDLTITMPQINADKPTDPVRFRVVREKAQLIPPRGADEQSRLARQAMAQHFLVQKLKAHKDGPLANLTPSDFKPKWTRTEAAWTARYSANLPEGRIVTLDVIVSDDGKILSPHAGFVIGAGGDTP